ncbi:hypothetical protein MIND_00984600 [Mycena indigotica]|uniref:Uncharacterized protein n=1 Tax=Mycena indigotica TaxID=2126181 RepID=A0A8H6SFP6_9AGAR|nr:uncharacterized protein MIND_00984600 [Mycena indigotica]KAF7297507.1 hypothetical protein MIND_00984600 [Mycena indigotica]
MFASRSLSPSFSRSPSSESASVPVRPAAFGPIESVLDSILGGEATGIPETKVLDPITSIITGIDTQLRHTGPPTTATPRSTSAPGAAPPKTPPNGIPQSPASTAPPGSTKRGALSTFGPGVPPNTSVGSLGHASASGLGSESSPRPSSGPTVTAMTTATTTERIATPARLNLALIVGVIVGMLLFLAGMAMALYWWRSRRRRAQATTSIPYPASDSDFNAGETLTAGLGVRDAPYPGIPSSSTQELLGFSSSSSASSNEKESASSAPMAQPTLPLAPTAHIHSYGLRPLPTPASAPDSYWAHGRPGSTSSVRAPGTSAPSRGSFETLPPYSR